MKRLSEEAGVDDDAGCSNSEPGKKVRVLDTTTGFCLQESDMEIQDHRENGGIRVLNPIEVKVSDSEEQDSSGRNQQIENKPMFMEEDKAFRRSEGCGFRDSERCNDNDHERDLGNTGQVSVCCNSASSEPITRVDYDVRGQENAEFDLNVEQFDIDLNFPAMETEESKNVGGFLEHSQLVAQRVDIIEVSSDESEEDRGGEQGGRISVSGGRRYTREEKGKVELVDSSWLSLDLIQQDLIDLRRCIASQPEETSQLLKTEISQFGREGETASARQADGLRERREARNRYRAISRDDARRFARFNSHQEHYVEPLKQETQMLTTEANTNLENFMGPFSTAMKLVKERKSKLSAQLLINWKPLNDLDRNILMHRVPSLLDLSMKVLAENANEIVSLECVPDALKHRLADMLCDSRKMNVHALDLLVQGSPTEIRIKDCSWITEEQFTEIFASFDAKNLKVLQLDLCGQCVHGDSLGKTVARSRNSLPDLAIISLKGACRLTDIALKELVASAPALQSINLGECSLLTCTSIYILATYLGAILRELYIDNCHQIDAKLIALTMRNFKHLEVLSVAGIQTVCDEFLVEIITKCGQNLKELDLADCLKLTNISMEVIGNTCSGLCSLNISNLHKLTDLAIQYLANGCQSLQKLKLRDNGFSDEAIATFLETSGKSLKELSLNKLGKVGPNTALSLAKCSKELLSLDLSWCRKITNESLGLIVDSCLSLKLLKLFGCTQISDEFLNCHSNSQVTIIGLSRTPVVEQLNMPGPEVAYLRYSPLTLSFDSQSSVHSDS